MLTLIMCTTILVILVINNLVDMWKYADFYTIKGPKTVPILGNALIFGIKPNPIDVFQSQIKFHKRFGDFFRLIMGNDKVLVIGKPEHVEVILGSTRHINKSKGYNMFSNWLGNGLLNSNGSHWRKHRKIISPAFHYKCLQDYSSFMCKNLHTLINILQKKKSSVININDFVKLYALDTICESAMRYNINVQANVEHPYVRALKGYLEIHITRFFSIFLRPAIVFKNIALGRQQAKYVDCMKSLTENVINSRKANRADSNSSSTDTTRNEFDERPKKSFLDLLLDKQDEGGVLSNAEIRDEVSTFLFGGHDTVSSSISFCLYELARHPDIQNKLVEESYTVMPQGRALQVDCANISALKYLDRVVKECMRIYTTVPFIERQLEEDVVLDGKRIPVGTTIQVMIYMMHNNPEYYPEPEKFDPERFNTENSRNRHPYAYIPFSAGPRNCIGYKYGQLMTKATVINILRNFKISLPDDGKLEPILFNSAILESANGINVLLDNRF